MGKKPTTSILPYLRSKEKQAQEAAEAEATANKSGSSVSTYEVDVLKELSEFDKARLAILRGEE